MNDRIPCWLTFNKDGTVAELYHAKRGLKIARFGVRGPFKRNAEAADQGYDETFQAEVYGLADSQYIDDKGQTVERRRR